MQMQEALRKETLTNQICSQTRVCVCTNRIGQYLLSEFDWILNDAHTQRFANNIGFVRKSKHIFKMNNNFVSTVFHDVNQTCS